MFYIHQDEQDDLECSKIRVLKDFIIITFKVLFRLTDKVIQIDLQRQTLRKRETDRQTGRDR